MLQKAQKIEKMALTSSFSDAAFVRMLQHARSTIQSSAGQKQWRSPTGCDAVLRLLRDPTKSDSLHEECWLTLAAALTLNPEQKEDPTCDITDFVVEKGVIKDIFNEFERQEQRSTDVVLVDALACLSGLCLLPRHVPLVVASGLIPKLLEVGESKVPEMVAVYSLISLTNLAIHKEAHDALVKADVLAVAERLLQHLDSDDESFMDCGLSGAFIICRLAGEDGPGLSLIKANPKVIQNLAWILNEVLVAGPKKAVLGANWDPANIVLDVSILSTSPELRPLMKDFVFLVTTALEKRSKGNLRLVKFSLMALSELVLEPSLAESFKSVSGRLIYYIDTKITLANKEKADLLKTRLENIASTESVAPDRSEASVTDGVDVCVEKSGTIRRDIPAGHTLFSWSGSPDSAYCGLGHTKFSWGS